jgi:hypothetical protein
MVVALAIHHYTIMGMQGYTPSRTEKLCKYGLVAFAYFLIIFQAVGIVRQQTHYTIDVFTSLYVVPLVWIVFYHFVPTDPVPSKTAVEPTVALGSKSPNDSSGLDTNV